MGVEYHHAAPGHECQCGLYAICDVHRAVNRRPVGGLVGSIAAWGNVELHAGGFRAQFAQVTAIAIGPRGRADAQAVANKYAVPCVDLDDLAATAAKVSMPADDALYPKRVAVALLVDRSTSVRRGLLLPTYRRGTREVLRSSRPQRRRKRHRVRTWRHQNRGSDRRRRGLARSAVAPTPRAGHPLRSRTLRGEVRAPSRRERLPAGDRCRLGLAPDRPSSDSLGGRPLQERRHRDPLRWLRGG